LGQKKTGQGMTIWGVRGAAEPRKRGKGEKNSILGGGRTRGAFGQTMKDKRRKRKTQTSILGRSGCGKLRRGRQPGVQREYTYRRSKKGFFEKKNDSAGQRPQFNSNRGWGAEGGGGQVKKEAAAQEGTIVYKGEVILGGDKSGGKREGRTGS